MLRKTMQRDGWIFILLFTVILSLHPETAFSNRQNEDNRQQRTDITNTYTLLAWNEQGVHLITDCSDKWVMLPPGNTIHAQLIKRGTPPKLVMKNVELHYRVAPNYENPSRRIRFWHHIRKFNGKRIIRDSGLTGNRLSGVMIPDMLHKRFTASRLPLIPYTTDNTYDPYPVINIVAFDPTGIPLTRTNLTSPVSAEWGCYHCHTGSPRFQNQAGIDTATARHISTVHDRRNGTDLSDKARHGRAVWCQHCHGDPSINMDGTRHLLNLSAAIHGFHAPIVASKYKHPCQICHAFGKNRSLPSLSDVHSAADMRCTSCHGSMEQHALSLLKMEKRYGKKTAKSLLSKLRTSFPNLHSSEISWRDPWLNQPDCMTCHKKTDHPNTQPTTDHWVENERFLYHNLTDKTGIYCAACHGASHSLHPVSQIPGMQDSILTTFHSPAPLTSRNNHRCLSCHSTVPQTTGSAPHCFR